MTCGADGLDRKLSRSTTIHPLPYERQVARLLGVPFVRYFCEDRESGVKISRTPFQFLRGEAFPDTTGKTSTDGRCGTSNLSKVISSSKVPPVLKHFAAEIPTAQRMYHQYRGIALTVINPRH